jgi:phosphoglycolate phosphatase
MAKELDEAGIQHCGIGTTHDDYPDPFKYDFKKNFIIDPDIKCVVVGYDHNFSYPKMLIGTTYAYQKDNLFIATNEDSQFPSESTTVVIPGCGAFVSALRTATAREPLILGKPHCTMWEVLKATHNLDERRSCMVGDRLETDIAFGGICNMRYTLAVFTGITNENEILDLANNNQDAINNNNKHVNVEHLVPNFYTDSLKDLMELSDS